MIVSYDGGSYNGWQRQGNIKATIQGTIEERLQQVLQEPIEIHGSGRTDADGFCIKDIIIYQS